MYSVSEPRAEKNRPKNSVSLDKPTDIVTQNNARTKKYEKLFSYYVFLYLGEMRNGVTVKPAISFTAIHSETRKALRERRLPPRQLIPCAVPLTYQ